MGMVPTEMARAVCHTPEPRATDTQMASIIPGMAMMMSMKRMSTLSTTLPKKPHNAPMTIPATIPMATEIRATIREYRPPTSRRVSRSRPSSSQPKGWARLGLA